MDGEELQTQQAVQAFEVSSSHPFTEHSRKMCSTLVFGASLGSSESVGGAENLIFSQPGIKPRNAQPGIKRTFCVCARQWRRRNLPNLGSSEDCAPSANGFARTRACCIDFRSFCFVFVAVTLFIVLFCFVGRGALIVNRLGKVIVTLVITVFMLREPFKKLNCSCL